MIDYDIIVKTVINFIVPNVIYLLVLILAQ